jgi:acetamidase/formamidase
VGTDLYTLVDNQLVPVTEVIDGEQVNITTVDYETRGEDKEFLDKLKNCKIYADVKDRIKIATDF